MPVIFAHQADQIIHREYNIRVYSQLATRCDRSCTDYHGQWAKPSSWSAQWEFCLSDSWMRVSVQFVLQTSTEQELECLHGTSAL